MMSSKALLIGFSFTLRSDGSPGRCNEAIARRMYDGWRSSSDENKPVMAVQWEIYDALEALGAPVETLFPAETLVAKPPTFTSKDIGSRMKLIEQLMTPGTPAHRLLLQELNRDPAWRQLPKAGGPNVSINELVTVLNNLLMSRTFYRPFRSLLDLHDLIRPTKGLVGLEKREIPRAGPGGEQRLGRFQTMRINRLIIEEIVPETVDLAVGPNESSATIARGPYECRNHILKRGQYLNVEGVARSLLTTFKEQAEGLLDIKVYGHPEHRKWCEGQTAKMATELGLKIGGVGVPEEDPWSEAEKWDENSAQLWCRSSENWSYYQAL
jgi:hypothetical protein